MRQWKMSHLDPRNASRTPSANKVTRHVLSSPFSIILICVLIYRNHLFVFVMKVQLTPLHRGLGITRDLLITRIPSLIVLQLIVLPWVAPSGHCHPTMVCFFRSTFLFLVPDPHIGSFFYVFVDFIVFIYLFLSSRSIVFYKVYIFFIHSLVLKQKKSRVLTQSTSSRVHTEVFHFTR